MTHAWLILAAGLASGLLTYLIWQTLDRRRIVDVPNERSMHKRPTPVGAGWAIVASVLLLWPGASGLPFWSTILVVAAMLVLAGIGWIDDLWPLPPLLRFAVQALVVAICLVSLTGETLLLGGWLPRWLERLLTAVAWLWFINLYNFMDGIDGITGTETIFIGLGYVVIAATTATTGMHTSLAFILIGAAAGFLVWNWHPARIFMGDVGSVPLGFLLGFLMLDLALRGQLAAALILPLYHLADATFTLLKRTLTVLEPWKPHRQHFYQRAVTMAGGTLSVPAVVLRIAGFNAFLILLAVKSIHRPWLALLLAGVGIAAMLAHLERAARPDHQKQD